MSFSLAASGNIVADPILRFSKAGKAVCSFRLAVDNKDKPTVFFDCTCFSFIAENFASSCSKGDRVILKGRMEAQEWTDKDTGKPRSKNLIIVEDVGPSLLFAQVGINKQSMSDYSGDNLSKKSSQENREDFDNNDITA